MQSKLTELDMEKRVTTCGCNTAEANPVFLDHLWFSDKAHLLLSGHVNSENNVFATAINTEVVTLHKVHSMSSNL